MPIPGPSRPASPICSRSSRACERSGRPARSRPASSTRPSSAPTCRRRFAAAWSCPDRASPPPRRARPRRAEASRGAAASARARHGGSACRPLQREQCAHARAARAGGWISPEAGPSATASTSSRISSRRARSRSRRLKRIPHIAASSRSTARWTSCENRSGPVGHAWRDELGSAEAALRRGEHARARAFLRADRVDQPWQVIGRAECDLRLQLLAQRRSRGRAGSQPRAEVLVSPRRRLVALLLVAKLSSATTRTSPWWASLASALWPVERVNCAERKRSTSRRPSREALSGCSITSPSTASPADSPTVRLRGM